MSVVVIRSSALALFFVNALTVAAQEQYALPATEVGNCALTAERARELLSQTPETFDQSLEGGRLQLEMRHCYVQAGLLADLYVNEHRSSLNESQIRGIKFHAGQSYARSGVPLYELAAAGMLETNTEIPSSTLNWNVYLLGTVAFLKRDLAGLKARHKELQESPLTPGNKMNLAVLDSLIRCFDDLYLSAVVPPLCKK
jgi:hypothetical protein